MLHVDLIEGMVYLFIVKDVVSLGLRVYNSCCFHLCYLFIVKSALVLRDLQLVIEATVKDTASAAHHVAEVGATGASFVWAGFEVHIVLFDHLICSKSVCRNETLMKVEELANPCSDRNHIKEDYRKDDPLWPSQYEIFLPFIQLTALSDAPHVCRNEQELE